MNNFMDMISAEGCYLHYPRAGGLYDQPAIDMEIYNMMRSVYLDEIRRKTSRG